MNKFILLIICSCLLLPAGAQTLASIKDMVASNRIDEARDAITGFLAQPGNEKNADAWYFKGYIYNALSKDGRFAATATTDKSTAFTAFRKCFETDPKNKWMATEEYASVFDLYNGFFELAAGGYRGDNFSVAFDNFRMADTVQQFLYHYQLAYKGFKFTKTDTNLLLNTAICAFRAKREKEGAPYYARIADARIPDPAYLPVYHALVDHYISIKDEIAFRKYLRIGRELFPYDQYWVQAETDMVKARGVNDALIKTYEEKLEKTPTDYTLNYNFSADLFNMIYTAETKPENPDLLKKKLQEQLERTLALQQRGVLAELLTARYHYNEAFSLTGRIKAGQQTIKEREVLEAMVRLHLEKAWNYADKVYHFFDGNDRLKRSEVEGFRLATEILANVAETNQEADKVTQYRSKLQEIAKIKPVRQ